MPDIELIPEGDLEGCPAVRLVVPSVVEPNYLIRLFSTVRRPGIRVLWLESASWGTQAIDDCLAFFLSDPRSEGVILWAQRTAYDPKWCATPIWNTVDLGNLLAPPRTVPSLLDEMIKMPFIPRPSELVVHSPCRHNLLPSLLDEVSTRLDPEIGGWIYVDGEDPDYMQAAIAACASSSTRWAVRKLSRGRSA